ncbi:TPA: restriction endonuclease subunit S [Escherichia coli]|nr:restriction endonuclease subunit S [Escherichia coli]HAW2446799.1 restriction endonuclease subunit S [Escherichia coli]HAW2479264.1 restriction endonuclease subunit S [Escherichia coli]HDQ6721351.1 restriction endonuclease subunit S [Escherichia coli O146:H21]HDQ6987558.1 restriction endonuclease subunit S [Escherichia coli O113:H21]
MSELSYLEKLLDGVEVEWLPLGEVSALRRGRVMSKGYLTENFGPYPVYSSQTANNGKIGSINTFDFDGEYISWTTDGANAGTVFYRTGKFSITNVCGLITLKSKYPLIYKFLFYWLTIEAKKHVYSGMGNPKLMSHQVENIPVPIPCPDNPEKSLAIQSEIVRILDKFSALTAELTAELNMRKKQYNYYRDKLLNFKDIAGGGNYILPDAMDGIRIEWKTLGEVAVIGTGNHDTQDAIEHGKYIFYARGREPLKLNVFDFDETAIITAGDGAGVGKVFHYAKGKYALHQRAYRIVPNAFMNPRFVYHYITAYFFTYIQKASVSSSVTSLRRPMFLKFPIPVPPSEEQARIVEILDKFDTLTNSITEGLPREIELRQKQYEYYRDLLFSFPKPETVSN